MSKTRNRGNSRKLRADKLKSNSDEKLLLERRRKTLGKQKPQQKLQAEGPGVEEGRPRGWVPAPLEEPLLVDTSPSVASEGLVEGAQAARIVEPVALGKVCAVELEVWVENKATHYPSNSLCCPICLMSAANYFPRSMIPL